MLISMFQRARATHSTVGPDDLHPKSHVMVKILKVIFPLLADKHDEPARRRKTAISGFNVIFLVLLGWIGITTAKALWECGRGDEIPLLASGLLLCLVWMLWGVAPVLERMIRDPSGIEPITNAAPWWRRGMPFILVELLLVLFVIQLVLPANPGGILKALLLPVIAHAVLLLSGPWLVVTIITCFTAHFALLSRPGMDFFLEAVFTIVCVQMVVATERSHAEAHQIALRLAQANSELAAHALQAEELAAARERSRMAREVHDLIGHYLTVVRVQLEAALSIHENHPEKAMEAVRNARECAGEGLREIRHSVESLRAGPLENRSLCEALLALVTESERSGQSVHLIVEGSERTISRAAALTLYRASQEALTNARKHAPLAQVSLKLQFLPRGEVVLTASDNGHGLPADFSPGFGLTGLRERADLIGGSLVLGKTAQGGFSFTLSVPS
jgi:signal transduction histidine kinase